MKRWTNKELNKLRGLVNNTNLTNKELGKLFNRTASSIERALSYHKIARKNRFIKKEIKYDIDKKTECWNCYSHFCSRGYPKIKRNGKSILINKFFFEKKYGKVPKGKLLCHKCNNCKCINPDHLYIGTYQDNSNDRCKAGNNGKKLNEQKVKKILKLLKQGYSNSDIARIFKVNQSIISRIKNNKRWKLIER